MLKANRNGRKGITWKPFLLPELDKILWIRMQGLAMDEKKFTELVSEALKERAEGERWMEEMQCTLNQV